ncbi:uncharacterized protein B0H18DRAFT_955290 [Fomitopsis serialis]|uniref:uncharacterized protein n=1 Tax=Fomitopsis serialis TaxID=139415 RepID=UPI002007CFA2|nr:uncharacterized protein B0H18DRAFT_955290 [Neoantrodia serialis]KAH9924891.1 hypothetical protein B0H18DRAFT_955290 [Neoantrodia serialis]
MPNRVDRVVFVDTSMSMMQLRNAYAQCGSILSISPWGARADRIHLTCFVEFAEESAVKRARAIQLPDTKLHIVSFSPQLIAHFLSIAEPVPPLPSFLPSPSPSINNLRLPGVKQEPRDSPRPLKRLTEDGDIASSTESTPRKKLRRSEKSAGTRPSTSRLHDRDGPPQSVRTADPRTPRATVKSPLASQPSSSRQSSGKENDARPRAPQTHTASPKRMLPLPRRGDTVDPTAGATPTPRRDAHAGAQSLTKPVHDSLEHPAFVAEVEGTTKDTPNASGVGAGQLAQAALSLTSAGVTSHMVTLNYNGMPVTCDLRKLEEDPKKIIAVLKATASSSPERDKWMVVAAQYRVRGHFMAAIHVLDAMVEVMTGNPVSLAKADLKPTFLMLSSCHRDIVAQGDSKDAAFHVYGVDVPRAQVTSEFAEARARSCMDIPGLVASGQDDGTAHVREYLADAGNLPAAPSAQEQSPSKKRTRQDPPTPKGPDNNVSEKHNSTSKDAAHHDTGVSAPRTEPERDRERSTSHSSASASRSYSERDKHGQVQLLEREIKALRNRAAEADSTLLNVRTAKRKLEEDLVISHAARRRAERDIEAVTSELARVREELGRAREEHARTREDVVRLKDELSRARRGEESALEQAAAEVESRRAAGRRVEEMGAEMGRLRDELRRADAEVEVRRETEVLVMDAFAKLEEALARPAPTRTLRLTQGSDGDAGVPSGRRGEWPATPVSERGIMEDVGRSRSVSASGRSGWGPMAGIKNERR